MSERVNTWLWGHTHYNCDYVDDGEGETGKRCVTNQKSGDGGGGYREGFVLEL